MAEQHVLAALKSGGSSAAYAAARLIAQGWHGGNDHNMTALSHGQEWSDYELREEIDQLMSYSQSTPAEKRVADEELRALREWSLMSTDIHSVWSSHGHTFLREDGDGACLNCGGRWQLVHDSKNDVHHGRYRTWNGDDPTECTGNTSMVHGEGECSDHVGHDAPDECPNCCHDIEVCNCLSCTG